MKKKPINILFFCSTVIIFSCATFNQTTNNASSDTNETVSEVENEVDSWFSTIKTKNLKPISLTNVSEIISIGRLGRGIPLSMINDLAFSPDGNTLAVAHNDFITLWNWEDGELKNILPNPEVYRVASIKFHPNGKLIAFAVESTIFIWDIKSGIIDHEYFMPYCELHGRDLVFSMDFSKDGKLLASGVDDGVVFWNTETGEIDSNISLGTTYTLTFNPDGDILAFSSGGYDNPKIFIYDIRSEAINGELIGHMSWIESLSFNHNGSILSSSDNEGLIIIWDVATRNSIQEINSSPYYGLSVNSLDFSPVDDVLSSAGDDGMIRFWDVRTGELIIEIGGEVIYNDGMEYGACDQTCLTSIEFSPDGRVLAIGMLDGTIRLLGVP